MRNKLTLMFCSFLLAICFTLSMDAQQQKKKKNTTFNLEIVEYSNKPDTEFEHHYLLSLTNNSNKTNEYKLSSKSSVKCKMDRKNVVRNRFGDIDSDEVENKSNSLGKKRKSNFSIEIYDENRNQKIDKVSLSPKESVKIYAKITRLNNADAGEWKCNKVSAKLLGDKNQKRNKRSVKIASFIPNPNNQGH